MDLGCKIAAALKAAAAKLGQPGKFIVLGPAPAPIEKLRGKYRVQLLVKVESDAYPVPVLGAAFEDLGKRKLRLKNVLVDVDPLSLL